MKLCLLSIATAFLSFVAAAPALAPRGVSPFFTLVGLGISSSSNHLLQVKQSGGQLGWFIPPAPVPVLHLLFDATNDGTVLDSRGNQMVFRNVTPLIPLYQVLLVPRSDITRLELAQSTHFNIQSNRLSYKGNPNGWFACRKSQGELELYYGGLPLVGCQGGYQLQLMVIFQQ